MYPVAIPLLRMLPFPPLCQDDSYHLIDSPGYVGTIHCEEEVGFTPHSIVAASRAAVVITEVCACGMHECVCMCVSFCFPENSSVLIVVAYLLFNFNFLFCKSFFLFPPNREKIDIEYSITERHFFLLHPPQNQTQI